MRRRWIIPFAIFIILILAFIFRWDYGPTTTYNSGAFKVQHKVDRWTGRPWVVLYGAIDNETYSNCEIPRTKTGLKLSTKNVVVDIIVLIAGQLKARKPVIYMGKNIAQIKRFYKPNNIAMLKKPNISDVNRQFKGVKIMIFAKR
jgi:hypothetical protein